MSRGNRPSAKSAPAGTSHHPLSGEQVLEIVPEVCSRDLIGYYAEGLPPGTAHDTFMRAVDELGGKGVLRDFDLQFLQAMALHFWYAERANAELRHGDLMQSTEWGSRPNPALKIARDEEAAAMRIADQYGLTFVSRLRAGILQLAGQSMLEQMHGSVASAMVSRILEYDALEQAAVQTAIKGALEGPLVCDECGRDDFKSRRGLASHRRAHERKRAK